MIILRIILCQSAMDFIKIVVLRIATLCESTYLSQKNEEQTKLTDQNIYFQFITFYLTKHFEL